MLSLDDARALRDAGLRWVPRERDWFAVPGGQMDDHVFVISELTALVQLYQGEPVVSFHGTSEWALDHVMVSEVVWLPTETQLREQLEQRLGPDAPLRLDRTGSGYALTYALAERMHTTEAEDAVAAYARALVRVLGGAD